MTSKRCLCGLLLALCLGLAGCETGTDPSADANEESTEGPNILIFLTDDQRAGTLSVMPRLRRWMGSGGTRYANAFATTPLCCPSRSSIMTGRFAHNHGIRTNPAGHLLDQETTLQRTLAENGYGTAMFGKFLSGWNLRKDPPYFDRFAMMDTHSRYSGARWNVDGRVRRVDRYATGFIQDLAEDFVRSSERRDDRPWYLYLAPPAPHAPRLPEPKYANLPVPEWRPNPAVREANRRDKPPYLRRESGNFVKIRNIRRRQLRTLASVDDLVDGVFRTLEGLDESRDTLAFYLSDNGFLWGEHGLPGTFLSKSNPYLHSIKVPFLARWPGHLPAGMTDQRFVTNLDIAPTVLDAAELARPRAAIDGRSLLEDWSRKRLLLEYWRSNESPVNDWASTLTRTYQYTEYYGPKGSAVFREYYNLKADPWQLTNLLRDPNAGRDLDVAALHALLARDRRCKASACP